MKIMHMVDLSPRICLILMLPSGVTLMAASSLGRDVFYGWPLVAVWVASITWLAIMLVDFFHSADKHAQLVHRLDWLARIGLVVGLLAAVAYTSIVTEPFGVTTNPTWLAGKVAAYALCIFGGIMIRVCLRPVGPAFHQITHIGPSAEANDIVASAVRRSVPFVILIWSMIVVATVLGLVKPGTAASP